MAEAHATAPIRTWANMERAKSEFQARIAAGEAASTVCAEANRIGVNYAVRSAFAIPPSGINPIGPDPNLDNPWSCCPPVFLHGMEAGTLLKLAYCSLNYIIRESGRRGIKPTTTCRDVDAFCAKVYV